MTALPLLAGIVANETGEFARSYPLNLEPMPIDSKLSNGQLHALPGAIQAATAPGADRGGIMWENLHYRVMGTKLVQIGSDWTITVLGDVGPGSRCAFDYSFDRLAIWSSGKLFYYTPAAGLVQVTDTDLGTVIDGLWIDSYFMSTDGTYVVVTELSDPMQIKPLKFGSAEEDPDAVTGLIKYREEAYVLGRFTTQVFQNVGGTGFPFADRKGAGFPFGCVSATAKTLFSDGFAFVGSARNEGLNVYIAGQGTAQPIGCRELCSALDALPNPAVVEVEARSYRNEHRLFIHLPDQSWVFLLNATQAVSEPVWYKAKTDDNGYRCRNAVEAYGITIVGDSQSGAVGYLTPTDNDHFGIDPQWGFDVGLIYNESLGAILDSVELAGLPGRGGDGAVFLSLTRDGETFSMERAVRLTGAARSKRIAWRPHSRIGNYLGLRFRGNGKALPGIAACEAKLRPLSS